MQHQVISKSVFVEVLELIIVYRPLVWVSRIIVVLSAVLHPIEILPSLLG